MNRYMFNKFNEELVRIDSIILLAGCLSRTNINIPDKLREFLEETDFEVISRCFSNDLPEHIREEYQNGNPDIECIIDSLIDSEKLGFLIQVSTPTCYPGERVSWFRYRTKWFYGQDLDFLIEIGFKWAAEQKKEMQTKPIDTQP